MQNVAKVAYIHFLTWSKEQIIFDFVNNSRYCGYNLNNELAESYSGEITFQTEDNTLFFSNTKSNESEIFYIKMKLEPKFTKLDCCS